MSPRIRNLLLTSTALLTLGSLPGAAGPDGGVVVGGSATIRGQGTGSVIVNQTSNRAIVNWHTFDIGTGESARFNQPNSSSVILNRVTGGMGASTIDGMLSANGRVFVINRDGMLFGRNARINTAGFVASTSDINNSDFMAGRYNFNRPGRPDASIVNLGNITASSHGFAALVAPGVRNSGTITATLGTVSLASGNTFTLDMYGDKLIQVGVSDEIAGKVIDVATGRPLKSLVSNDGTLRANGGRVELTAAAARHIVNSVINTKGVIEANSVGVRGGKIVLGGPTDTTKRKGLPKQTVKVAGKLTAKGTDKGSKGGTIKVTGEDIRFAAAMVDVSGHSGGGKVLIGGDWAGGRPGITIDNKAARLEDRAIPTATTLTVDSATTINASATHRGDGGKVILWSDVQTTFAGTIAARGGTIGGDGGFVEVSGKQQLAYSGHVDTLAPHGLTGTLLLDPHNLTISGDPSQGVNGFTATADDSVLNVGTLIGALASNNVVVSTGTTGGQRGDITVAAAISWNAATTLTLNANLDININAAITASNNNGGLTLISGGNINVPTAAVNVGRFILEEGSWRQVNSTLPAFSARDFRIIGGEFVRATGGNGDNIPWDIADVYGLQGINTRLGDHYRLVNDIGASGTVHWNDGKGFKPIGGTGYSGGFTGSLDGQNFVVSGLHINRGDALHVGLFGSIDHSGSVSNLGIVNANVTSTYSGQGHGSVGILAGYHAAADTISNVYTTGTVTGMTSAPGLGPRVGGLVGWNDGTIEKSYSGARVRTIGNASSPSVGGLVGYNTGTIRWSYASGDVDTDVAMNSAATGGAVGTNHGGTLEQVYATGLVKGSGNFVGGLVGQVNGSSSIINSYWDNQTSGQQNSAGGTGLTTAQLQAGLQNGWDSSVWAIVPGVSYPYLKWQVPAGTPQVVSGILYSDRGLTPVADGHVAGLVNGTEFASLVTGGAVRTGPNGYYYFLVAPGTIPGTNAQVLVYATNQGAITGATLRNNAPQDVHGLDIYGNYFRGITNVATLTQAHAGRDIAIGNHTFVNNGVAALPHRELIVTAATFDINESVNRGPGTLIVSSTGAVTQSAPITAGNLLLHGAGGSYILTHAGNQIGTLAANAGTVRVRDDGGLTVGTVHGTSGVTADALVISSTGTVTQTAAIDVKKLALLGSGGSYTLNHPGNAIVTLAANTGSVSVRAADGFDIGTVNLASVQGGVNADTFVITTAGTVTQSAPITVAKLALSGDGGSYILAHAGNQIGMLAAQTGSAGVTDKGGLVIGTVAGLTGMTADALALSSTGAVTQIAPIIVDNLALRGAGGSYTLTNVNNQIGTLAANTGSVHLVDQGNINIGTVAGISGVTTTGALTMRQIGSTITATAPVDVGLFNLVAGNWVQNAATLPAFAATDFRIGAGASFLRVTGGVGSAASPYKIADVYGLQGINNQGFFAKSFVLANDIDASGTAAWNAGKGFVPIAVTGGPFTGTLDGQSNTISGLVIAPNDATTSSTGLFSVLGNGAVVRNLTLTNATVSANPGFEFEPGFAMGRDPGGPERRHDQPRERGGYRQWWLDRRCHRRWIGRHARHSRPHPASGNDHGFQRKRCRHGRQRDAHKRERHVQRRRRPRRRQCRRLDHCGFACIRKRDRRRLRRRGRARRLQRLRRSRRRDRHHPEFLRQRRCHRHRAQRDRRWPCGNQFVRLCDHQLAGGRSRDRQRQRHDRKPFGHGRRSGRAERRLDHQHDGALATGRLRAAVGLHPGRVLFLRRRRA